jgi:lantibiotic modifying enzyme
MARYLEGPWSERASRDVEAAFETTLLHGFGTNHSLCHGDLGSLDFLLQAAVARDDPEWRETVRRTTARVVAGIDHNGWICGVPTAIETPGLMNGLAGIGYGLLRLAEPETVPSVLALEPPAELL